MTTAGQRRPPGAGRYPWHDPPPAVAPVTRAALRGTPAGLVTRALANTVDLLVVALLVAGGYAAVAATRFLVDPTSFSFPVLPSSALLLVGLGVQAAYFAVTWAAAGATYGDRLLGLRVTDGRGGRPGWGRSAVRAVLCTLVPIGLLWVLVSRGNRSLQDLLLRTCVRYD
ncbi:RDD family protein [Geodermatophilus sp. SYSU D00697]